METRNKTFEKVKHLANEMVRLREENEQLREKNRQLQKELVSLSPTSLALENAELRRQLKILQQTITDDHQTIASGMELEKNEEFPEQDPLTTPVSQTPIFDTSLIGTSNHLLLMPFPRQEPAALLPPSEMEQFFARNL